VVRGSCRHLVGVERRQRQRMDASCEFFGERFIDEALPRHYALANKRGGHDGNGKMSLAFRPGTLMPGVAVRLIFDLEPGRGEPFGQLAADRVGDAHCAKVIGAVGFQATR